MTTALRYLHLTLLLILSLGCIAAAQQPIRPGEPFPELQLKVPTAAEAHEPRLAEDPAELRQKGRAVAEKQQRICSWNTGCPKASWSWFSHPSDTNG